MNDSIPIGAYGGQCPSCGEGYTAAGCRCNRIKFIPTIPSFPQSAPMGWICPVVMETEYRKPREGKKCR